MGNVTSEDNFSHYQEMIFGVARAEFGICSQPSFECPNPNAKSLCEGYVHSKFAIRMLSIKSKEFRLDSYASNLGQCVNVAQGSFSE